jgi:hypothetical protein
VGFGKFKSHLNSLFYGWVFTNQGLGIFAAIGAASSAGLTKLTASLDVYAPISYLLAAFIGAIFSSVLIFLFRQISSPLYKGETSIIFSFDGSNLIQEDRKNVWGWKYVSRIFSNRDTGQKIFEEITLTACFDRQISPDTLILLPAENVGLSAPVYSQIVYEGRYAIIQILSIQNGRYKIEFKGHK